MSTDTMQAWTLARSNQRDIATLIADFVLNECSIPDTYLTEYQAAKDAEQAAFEAWSASTRIIRTEHLSTEEN